jgi:ParB family chromosome partitioning protein
MAKLNIESTPGFNAAKNIYAKAMRVDDIIIDPEISQIFKIQKNMQHEILQKIKNLGFDKSQPLTIQKGTNVLLDGHTRLAAAKDAGLEEVPVVEMEFDDRKAAMMYTFERQALRRNLSASEILKAAQMLPDERNRKGEGPGRGRTGGKAWNQRVHYISGH